MSPVGLYSFGEMGSHCLICKAGLADGRVDTHIFGTFDSYASRRWGDFLEGLRMQSLRENFRELSAGLLGLLILLAIIKIGVPMLTEAIDPNYEVRAQMMN